ncbi:MAG: hypothetical protein C0506_16130 [Anaerolinea sp.]|nr:hypothetical protein [Anaerolinea sp.]
MIEEPAPLTWHGRWRRRLSHRSTRRAGRRLLVLVAAAAFLQGCAAGSGGTTAPGPIAVTLTEGGCEPTSLSLSPGRVTFVVQNRNSPVTSFSILSGERPIAQVNNVLGGLTRNLVVDLKLGTYTMRCRQSGVGGDGTLVVSE